jgi:Aspartyl protease/PDZ domain
MLRREERPLLFHRLFDRMRRSLLLLITAITSLTGALGAQEAFVQPASKFITKFPFTVFQGGVILIRAQLDNFPDTLNFILDTGSGGISLDSGTCERLRLSPQPSDKTILGIAGIRQVKFLYNETLHLPNLKIDSLDFHVNDYDILTSVYGDKIDGIIGFSFFSRYIVQINYDSMQISVFTRGPFRYPRGGFMLRPIIAGLPIVGAELKEDSKRHSSRFYFDTGAGLCALLSTDYVADSNLLDTRKKIYYTQAQGMGGKANMQLTTVKEVKVGPYRFRNVPTYLFEDQYNVTSYPSLAGLVGNDILRRFNVTLNYDRRSIYLLPNSHYKDQFDYSYTGLSLYWEDGEVRVGDIMQGSPAEKAGLKADDVVVAVSNNFSNNIQTWKNLLQNAGEKIPMLVKRNTELLQLKLVVKSIR